MISSIGAGGPPPPPPQSSGTSSISDEQSEGLASLLENYDAGSLTADSAKEIVSEISALGIEPGRDLHSALSEAGFDAKEIGDLAGVGPRGGPGSSGGADGSSAVASVNTEALAALSTLLDGYEVSEMTQEDWTSVLVDMQSQGYATDGQLINFTA